MEPTEQDEAQYLQDGDGDGGENQEEALDYEGVEGGEEGESQSETQDAPEAEPAAPRARTAPAFNLAGMTQAQRDEINELALTDPVAAFERYSDFRDSQNAQRGQLTDFHADTLAETAPVFMQRYGKHIRAGIAEVNKHQPGSEDAINVGVANAFLQEVRQSKDIAGTIDAFHAAIHAKDGAGIQESRPAKTALPAGQRATSPGVSTSGRGAAPAAQNNRAPQRVRVLMDSYGMTRAEAERAADA